VNTTWVLIRTDTGMISCGGFSTRADAESYCRESERIAKIRWEEVDPEVKEWGRPKR